MLGFASQFQVLELSLKQHIIKIYQNGNQKLSSFCLVGCLHSVMRTSVINYSPKSAKGINNFLPVFSITVMGILYVISAFTVRILKLCRAESCQ